MKQKNNKLWQNSKTQIVTKLKISNCDSSNIDSSVGTNIDSSYSDSSMSDISDNSSSDSSSSDIF